MRVGVVADNHRLIDPALPELLAGVDEIWHAGDLVTPAILPVLRAIAPVQVVRGNNDQSPAFAHVPDDLVLEREGLKILLRHIVGKPSRLDRQARAAIAQTSPDIVVSGHSHQPLAESASGVLYLNPGSCGPRRFSLPRTAAVLELTSHSAHFVVTDLDEKTALIDRSFVLPIPRSELF